MKKGLYSLVIASAVLGASSIAFAGAYGEAEQPEEIPAPAPAAPAPEPEPPKVMRKHVGFYTDSETTRGLRGEIGSFYGAEYHRSSVGDVEAANVYLHLSYGTELFEVGITAPPFIYGHAEGPKGLPDYEDIENVGDMRLWGKVIPLRKDNFTLGGGVVVSVPTGDGGAGTADFGFLPFLTGGAMAGDVDLRLSVGYDVYIAHGNPLPDTAYDHGNLNFAALYPVAENVVLRGEIEWNHFVYSNADPTSIYPGVDVTFALTDAVDLVLRPTVGIGLTEAPDWQVGLGIAIEVPQI